MRPASTTASTGKPNCTATSALLGSPSNKPITPSTSTMSLCMQACCSMARQAAAPAIHKSSWYTLCPLASACQPASIKSGPHLNTCTRKPCLLQKRASAAVTVVLPCPDEGAATSNTGQGAPAGAAGAHGKPGSQGAQTGKGELSAAAIRLFPAKTNAHLATPPPRVLASTCTHQGRQTARVGRYPG